MLNLKKFVISEDLQSVLDKQQTQLTISTAASAVGLAFIFVFNLVTIPESQAVAEIEAPEVPSED